MKVKGFFKDIKGAARVVKIRKQMIENASDEVIKYDPIRELAVHVHSPKLNLQIVEIKDETSTTKTFKFLIDNQSKVDYFPIFQAGQYMSFKFKVGKSYATRPYSISSAPFEARNNKSSKPFLEVTIRKKDGGFITKYIWDNWKIGTKVQAEGAFGHFYYEPLRDYKNITALAGGSGITPFHSMAREIANGTLDVNLTLIYGSKNSKDIIFYDEFKKLEKQASNKIKVIHVLSDDENWNGEKGFITTEVIKKYCDIKNASFFICGPQVMYRFLEKELKKLNLRRKQIRREVFGEVEDIYCMEDFREEAKGKAFNIKVHMGAQSKMIKGKSSETVLTALERNGIRHDSRCRSGECGFCRSQLISGEVYVVKETDGRREADKLFGYFHPCSSYPISDLEIKIPLC